MDKNSINNANTQDPSVSTSSVAGQAPVAGQNTVSPASGPSMDFSYPTASNTQQTPQVDDTQVMPGANVAAPADSLNAAQKPLGNALDSSGVSAQSDAQAKSEFTPRVPSDSNLSSQASVPPQNTPTPLNASQTSNASQSSVQQNSVQTDIQTSAQANTQSTDNSQLGDTSQQGDGSQKESPLEDLAKKLQSFKDSLFEEEEEKKPHPASSTNMSSKQEPKVQNSTEIDPDVAAKVDESVSDLQYQEALKKEEADKAKRDALEKEKEQKKKKDEAKLKNKKDKDTKKEPSDDLTDQTKSEVANPDPVDGKGTDAEAKAPGENNEEEEEVDLSSVNFNEVPGQETTGMGAKVAADMPTSTSSTVAEAGPASVDPSKLINQGNSQGNATSLENTKTDEATAVNTNAKSLNEVAQPAVQNQQTKANQLTSPSDFKYTIHQLLDLVIERNASDLHITVGYPVAIRVDGSLISVGDQKVSQELAEQLIFEILPDAKKELLEVNREVDLAYSHADAARFRINAYYQQQTLSAAFRLIPTRIRSIDELHLPQLYHQLVKLRQGLVLVTGPTGSGKSSTLAAILQEINEKRADHIITIEDPIEYILPRGKAMVDQRELHDDTHSWEIAMKSALRQDPDIVLVGEMRDFDTIAAAITLAETGHLVFATLHTNSAAQTVDRIIDVFPEHQQAQVRSQLSNVLETVIAQRLVPLDKGGRRAVSEIMIATPAVRNLIRESKTHQLDNVVRTSLDIGMLSMEHSLVKLVREGLINSEKAQEYAVKPEEVVRLLKG